MLWPAAGFDRCYNAQAAVAAGSLPVVARALSHSPGIGDFASNVAALSAR